jgi:hypothetical protein
MKYSQMFVDIKRVIRPDVDEPLFDMTLRNPMCVGGRPLSTRVILSWEDLVAIFQATKSIVARKSDDAQETAKKKYGTPFKELEE